MSAIDTKQGQTKLERMNYIEFLVFIARISHELHDSSEWPLHT